MKRTCKNCQFCIDGGLDFGEQCYFGGFYVNDTTECLCEEKAKQYEEPPEIEDKSRILNRKELWKN